MYKNSSRLTCIPPVTTRISITGGTAVLQLFLLRWLHHQSHLHSHSCSLRCRVRLYLTQFLSSDITFIARVKDSTYVKFFETYKSLNNITA